MNKGKKGSGFTGLEIAVIGMAGRFPGAEDVPTFWDNLKNGIDSVSFFSDEELLEAGIQRQLITKPGYVKAKRNLEGKGYFDSSFFGYLPAEAGTMDPQVRIFHECAWEALEDAGYDPQTYPGMIGLYAGATESFNWQAFAVISQSSTAIDAFTASQLRNKDFLAARVSYKLNLKGPVFFVQTACSTSLAALHLACRSLLTGECLIALAGGISITNSSRTGYFYREGMVASPDGHCRAFAAEAAGTVGGEGAAVVVLKKMKPAVADRDNISALIKGSALNNDGSRKVGFTAPSPDGQAEAIRMALKMARVEPRTISYIETHGTGTPLGDPIEMEALTHVFGKTREKHCALGAVKTNIGHMDAAAGAAGFIKTVLALKHRWIPPTLHFEKPNPAIDFDNGPFYVNTTLKEWNGDCPLRAGVSSFGIGGTNVHVILEEAPLGSGSVGRYVGGSVRQSIEAGEYRLLLLSARTTTALERMTGRLKNHLEANKDINLADAAYTLQIGRRAFAHRGMLVCKDVQGASQRLKTFKAGKERPFVVFMFPGLGSQYNDMEQELYRVEPLFREAMDRCLSLSPVSSHPQLALFAFEYALAWLWMQWGIKPDALIGYSYGEYAAACLAGVISLEDAVELVIQRERLLRRLPAGAMLSVPLPEKEILPLLNGNGQLSLAVVNGPSCIVSGTEEGVAVFEKQMKARRLLCMRVNVSHPAHSILTEPILADFKKIVGKISLHKPTIPYISNVSGTWIRDEEAVDPGYWAAHLRGTVQFARGLQELFKEKNALFVEVGPGKALSNFVRQQPGKEPGHLVINLIKDKDEKVSHLYYLNDRLGRLWLYGLEIDWAQFYAGSGEERRRISLPTYPFEKIKYPVDVDILKIIGQMVPAEDSGQEAEADPGEIIPIAVERPQMVTAYVGPSTPTEKALAKIWQDFFGIDRIGIDDDFFELGGDSLKAMNVAGIIHKKFNVRLQVSDFFAGSTVKLMAEGIDASQTKAFTLIGKAEKKEYYPLSPAQERLYILQQMEPAGIAYNLPIIKHLQGEPDLEKLSRAFRQIIHRHESLRTSFHMLEKEPVQRIHNNARRAIKNFDQTFIKVWPPAGPPEATLIRPFDLSRAPLLRVGIIKTGGSRYILAVDMHHIISDGVSQQILVKEFDAFYSGAELGPLRLQYSDYALWQKDKIKNQPGASGIQEKYWLGEFAGEIPVLNLPLDYPRPAVQSFEGGTAGFALSASETGALNALAAQEGVTSYMLLLALLDVLLSKLGGGGDIVVGTAVAGRGHTDLQGIIGMFVNTLALRNQPRGEMSFREFLKEVKGKALKAFENQEYPFEDLVEKVRPVKDAGRNPLFDVMFTLQTQVEDDGKPRDKDENKAPAEKRQSTGFEHRVAKFDLTLTGLETGGRLRLYWEYCTRLFKKETIKKFTAYFKEIIHSVLDNPVKKIADIAIISEDEKQRLLVEFNDTKTEYPVDKTIHELFAGQVARAEDRMAVIDRDRHLTYGRLNEESNRLAGLLKERGVTTDVIVAIKMERSIEMIVGIMGILQAGGAYLPIDPTYPRERIDYMLNDSSAEILLPMNSPPGRGAPKGRGGSMPCALRLAYVIYTSGTTGKPKGTLTCHYNVVRVVKNTNYINITSRDRVLQLSNYAFDGSVFDIYGALLNDAPLVMLKKEDVLAVDILADVIIRENITVFFITTALFNALVDLRIDCFKGIRKVLFGGENVSVDHSGRALEYLGKDRIIHVYGPTETTVYASYYFLNEIDNNAVTIPIGKPISNTGIYMLDNYMKPVPIGVTGEVYIGGDGLARGYLNRPQLTAEKFLTAKTREWTRIIHMSHMSYMSYFYKTGDLAKQLPDGNIEFLGRLDSQVKIRGFRIEPGEIEKLLLNHDDVSEAVVTTGEGEGGREKYLCAYIVIAPGVGDKLSGLRDYLSGKLPAYMIPTYFVSIAKLPLTPNGKVDRKALPEPGLKKGDDYAAPGNEIEEKLVEIWSEVLGIEKDTISIHDDFFQLGGHSLKATIVISKIHKELNVKIPLTELFSTPTIRGLFAYIKGRKQERYASIRPVEKRDYYALSPAQKRLYFLQQMEPESTVYNIPVLIDLHGEPQKARFEEVFKTLTARHESLRTSFHMEKDEPVQRIHEEEKRVITHHSSFIIHDYVRPFDLARAPLMRVELIEKEGKYRLLIDMHHIITDGTSQAVLTEEFLSLYGGNDEALTYPRLQYKDYSQWQNSEERRAAIKDRESYWLRLFSSSAEIPVLHLPTDYPRPLVQAFEGCTVEFILTGKETRTLKELAKQANATLYMVILAVFNILLAKLGGREDIVVGAPIAARRHADLQRIIGMFVNTLALRNYPAGDKTFNQFLQEVKESTLEAFENQEYPFEDLVDKLSVPRDTGRNPLFDVMFNLLNQAEYSSDTRETKKKQSFEHRPGISKFDLTLTAVDMGERLFFAFEYCTKLFKPATIERIISYFKRILYILAENSKQKLAEIEIITEPEKHRLLFEFNDAESGYPKDKAIHELFEDQVARRPDSMALAAHSAKCPALTYGELNEKSNRLAYYLSGRGVEENGLVGLMVERSLEMIIGILGILKAGCAYVPLNPKAPEARTKYILDECGTEILLTGPDISPVSPAAKNGLCGYPLSRGVPEGRGVLAYVIFTSGSTGKPKGVPITHANLSPLLHWGYNYLGLNSTDRTVQNLPYYFDWSVWEIFITLTSGASLYIVPDEILLNPEAYLDFFRERDITVLHITPTQYSYLVRLDQEAESLKYLLLGAEKLSYDLAKRAFASVDKDCRVFNTYGPTEAAIMASILEIHRTGYKKFETLSSVPIGRPLANTILLVLDKYLKLCPVNITGELYIGGDGLARGYLNNLELTAEKFLTAKTRDGTRIIHMSYMSYLSYIHPSPLYKTGDLAKQLPDGNIEFLGRIDHQVKIRGFRIELGEIENCLLKHKEIREAVVLVRKEEDKNDLCAYIAASPDRELSIPGLREYLAKSLPDYMIPANFVQIEKIPLTANGKVDRKSLPLPGVRSGEDRAAPANEIEEKLAAVWSGVLHIPKDEISVNADFFQVGGHSLKATILAAGIHKACDVKIPLLEIFRLPTIRQLSQYIQKSVKEKYIAIPAVEEKEYYPLTSVQERLYVLQRMEPGNTGYNMPQVIPLDTAADKEKLGKAFKKLIARHESFRTSFETINGQPVQRVYDEVEFEIEYFDLTAKTREGTRREMTIENFVRAFDLSRAPLLRAGLLELPGERQVLLLDMHHIISDGVSQTILEKEFMPLYSNAPLSPPRLRYRDYAEWLDRLEQKESLKRQGQYWLARFAGEPPVLDLPCDYPRPVVQSFAGGHKNFSIGKEETDALKALAAREDATMYMVLLTAFNLLLSRLGGQEDIVVGSPMAGRRHDGLQDIVGMFVNTLAMRNYPAQDKTVSGFLRETRENTLEAFENQDYPFEELVEKVFTHRDTGRNPLFDAMFTLQNLVDPVRKGGGPGTEPGRKKEAENFDYEYNISKFDLTLFSLETGERLAFSFEYCTRLFKAGTIDRFIDYFKKILAAITADPLQKTADIRLITEKEKRRILLDFNNTNTEYPRNKTIAGIFEERAARWGDRVAVICKAQGAERMASVSYKELNEKSNRLAHRLQENGVGSDTIIAIMMEPSPEMIAGILAILKAGGAYLPIDPGYPEQRKQYMLKDSGTQVLLIKRKEQIKMVPMGTDNKIRIPAEPPHIGPPRRGAYIIYTSGTTGKPKGTLIEHDNVVRLLFNDGFQFDFGSGDVWTMFHSFCFDFSVWEMYGALLYGGKLVLISKMTARDTREYLEILKREKVTVLNQTPAAFYNLAELELMDPAKDLRLKYVIFGGEALKPLKLKPWKEKYPGTKIINMYGITETTVHVTFKEIEAGDIALNASNIGGPIPTLSVYIVDKNLKLVPVGVAGELCVGGGGVARGYLNRPELTGEKFIKNLSFPGRRFYRSGDLARVLGNGGLEYLGRIDHQLKIRGFRVELGEIENRLLAHREIKRAAAAALPDKKGDKYLCAYIVADREIAAAELKEYLSKDLPGYMIPTYFIRLDKIPLTPQGKVDRKALPRPREADPGSASGYVAPGTGMQQIIAGVWREVLARDRVGIHDNFFDLGGNSLDFVKVSTQLKEKLEQDIPVITLFTYPTIASLEHYLSGEKGSGSLHESKPDRNDLIDEGKDLMLGTLKMLDEED